MSGRTPGTGRLLRAEDLRNAQGVISAAVKRPALRRSVAISQLVGAEVFLKPELEQVTGSFKERGAANRLLRLSSAERHRGVIAVSTGNHARAVSWLGQRLNVSTDIYLSSLVPENKVRAIRELGARINIIGKSYDEAFEEATREAERSRRVLIEPFDHPDIIAGQGTIGLEIIEDLPDVSTVVVPLSGGGLISGIALAVKSVIPRIRILGVSMEIGAAMHESQRAGRPVRVPEGATVADSLAGGIGRDNQYTFRLVRALVDDIVLVTEEQIEAAMRFLHTYEGLVTEGAAAVGVAALQTMKIRNLRGKVVLVISGGNVDAEMFARVLSKPSTNGSRGDAG